MISEYLMHWCFSCYALNPDPHGACVRCGGPIQGPPDYSYDDWLVWTLGHPDGGRAVLAAQILGVRRVRSALPALRQVVGEAEDPFLAAAALRSAITIAGSNELRGWLEELTQSHWFMVRELAQRALA